MTTPRVGGCPLDRGTARALGQVLLDAGYGQGTATLTGPDELLVSTRLFALGASVDRAAAAAALAPVGLEELEASGVLEARAGGRVGSPMRITPHEGLLLLHDRFDRRGPADQVAAVGPSSRTLASLTIRAPVELALDVGTGCGVQALLAARHARRVIATDLSRRALDVAAVNAALNAIDNVELRQGDLFSPVQGERFDLIVANPPFVISPETTHVFRDSGLAGDEVSRQVVEQAAEHLADRGHATILCEWLLREGEDWRDVPRRWVERTGCDTLALHYRTADPENYSAGWNSGLRERDPDGYVEAVKRWATYQRALGAVGVSTGALVLRRAGRSGSRFHAEEMPAGPSGAAGDHVLRLLGAADRVPMPDAGLLGARLALEPGQALWQLLTFGAAGWQASDAELRAEAGIGVCVTVPAPVVHVLLGLDGRRTLAEVVEQAAVELDAAPGALRDAALQVTRRLLELGLAFDVTGAGDGDAARGG